MFVSSPHGVVMEVVKAARGSAGAHSLLSPAQECVAHVEKINYWQDNGGSVSPLTGRRYSYSL